MRRVSRPTAICVTVGEVGPSASKEGRRTLALRRSRITQGVLE
jgi:hypothetical protein